jgi:predicted TIM-barrel fold metal-dependent hydrolase
MRTGTLSTAAPEPSSEANGGLLSRRGLLRAGGALSLFSAASLAAGAAVAKSRGLVDVHHHFSSPGFIEAITSRKTGQRPLMDWTPQQSLEDMDRAGVATAVVSISEPGVWFGDAGAARALARESNEYAARLAADHPGRFAFFAMLPLPDTPGSLVELEYALDVLKASGVCLLTSVEGRYPGDPAFAPVLAELNRRKAVVYTHPSRPPCCHSLVANVPDTAIELATDTTRAIASVLFSGAAARYPEVRFIFSHGGGTMPYILGRFEGLAQKPEMKAIMPDGALPELRKFYYDTAQACTGPALAALTQMVPASQILFGSDFPFVSCKAAADCLEGHVTPADLKMIGGANARALLDLRPTAA